VARSDGGVALAISYLALGDSYTIGTGASDAAHSWPSIVAKRLTKETGRQVEVTNPAVNGFTTLDLIQNELPYLERLKPDLVTILIGVNDLVQRRTVEQYEASLQSIYKALATLELPPGRSAAVSIPNWSVVPAAPDFGDPNRLRKITDSFNEVAEGLARGHGFTWIDITEVSTSGSGAGWVADDRLHPGDRQYAAWAEVIWNGLKGAWR
jgi:lysophospholipase L1-like esterase